MTYREVVCSQQIHCLSCPLSVGCTGKDCRSLTESEIKAIMDKHRKQEAENKGMHICWH